LRMAVKCYNSYNIHFLSDRKMQWISKVIQIGNSYGVTLPARWRHLKTLTTADYVIMDYDPQSDTITLRIARRVPYEVEAHAGATNTYQEASNDEQRRND